MKSFLLLLLSQLFLLRVSAQTIGTKVSMYDAQGKTYTGVIKQIQGDKYFVAYDGVDFTAWLTKEQFVVVQTSEGTATIQTTKNNSATAQSANYAVGEKVQGFSANKWYDAVIIEAKAGQYKLHYDGWAESWDEWLKPDKIRKKGEALKIFPVIRNSTVLSGKLYVRSMQWIATGHTEISWFFLSDNGIIIQNPKHGVNPVNVQLELKDNEKNIGVYTLNGNLMKIQWLNGQSNSLGIAYKNGDISELDAGGIMVRQSGLPANYKLNGTYKGIVSYGQTGNATAFAFKPDGSFATTNTGYVSANETNGRSANAATGTYLIKGNTLQLTYADGRTDHVPIGAWQEGGKTKYLVINATWFSLQ